MRAYNTYELQNEMKDRFSDVLPFFQWILSTYPGRKEKNSVKPHNFLKFSSFQLHEL